MAAKEMYDYLSEVTPDYSTTTLDIKCKVELLEDGEFSQKIHEGDDTSEEVISFSSSPKFFVQLQWPMTSEADTGTIMDFFLDTTKGYGYARSFKWEHPDDGHTYVVKFRSKIQRSYKPISGGAIYGINTIMLKVIGKIVDA
ncbi:MAG: hypothetical protein ACFFCW_37670 [Candidatus Hodarchaeota archaeon]